MQQLMALVFHNLESTHQVYGKAQSKVPTGPGPELGTLLVVEYTAENKTYSFEMKNINIKA
jgi:hypothetical protein